MLRCGPNSQLYDSSKWHRTGRYLDFSFFEQLDVQDKGLMDKTPSRRYKMGVLTSYRMLHTTNMMLYTMNRMLYTTYRWIHMMPFKVTFHSQFTHEISRTFTTSYLMFMTPCTMYTTSSLMYTTCLMSLWCGIQEKLN